jgi:hypothetical protein
MTNFDFQELTRRAPVVASETPRMSADDVVAFCHLPVWARPMAPVLP